MFDIGRKVVVITDNAITFDGTVVGRAKGDNGPGAYKVTLDGAGLEQMGQWHKACDVFVREEKDDDTQISWEDFTKR